MAERMLTVADVAEQLRVHPETVRRWIKAGKLRASLPGGRKSGWRVRQSEVDRLLTETEHD